jgi:lipoyl(octanoyl) transferase
MVDSANKPAAPLLIIRRLGRVEYAPTLAAMQAFTAARTPDTPDELWLLEHPPVFTLGQAGKREHLLQETSSAPMPPEGDKKLSGRPSEFLGGIPVVPIDRGGQVTYHGPGQVVIYLLLDLKRRGYGVKELVRRMEQAVINLLAQEGIQGERLVGAPGIYVHGAKIAALGLRVKGGCTYHGLALNVAMDLAPFRAINPCGYAGMAVTQFKDLGADLSVETAGGRLAELLQDFL